MRTFKRTLLSTAVALGLVASGSAAAQFTNMYFLGDSLTDAGIYGGARFTVNPGLVWAQDLGNTYGLAITPSNQGGTDYAQGGARVALPGSTVPGFAQRPLNVQVDELLKATPALNPKAIYAVWMGANDVLQNLGAVAAGQISATQAAGNVGLAATQEAAQLARLRAAGAQFIVVANIPDVGKTPGVAAGGPVAVAGGSQLTGVYNSTLNAAMDQLGFQVIRVNMTALFNEILANPSAYGFTNSTGVACTTSSALTCTTSTLVAPNADKTYMFADGVHPTPAGHVVLAQAVDSMITGPQQVAVLTEAPFAVEDANFRALDGRMWSSLNTPRTQKKLEAWAAYDYGRNDMNAGTGNGSANSNTLAVGADGKVSDNLLLGGMFGYTQNRGDFGGAGGGYKLTQPTGTMYAGYGEGPWYVGATFGAGGLDYSNVNRNIPLGAAMRNESGQTRGWEYTGRLLGGYWFTLQDVLHGPYARVTYTKSEVHAYSETGSDSTALAYGAQDQDQLVWSVGWQVAGSIGSVRPFARATWEYDSLAKDRSVTASSVSLGGSYSIPVAKPDNNYALFNLGASMDFGGVTGYLMGSGTAGRSDGNNWGITVGIRAPI